jgi:hypothetical protein
MFKGELMLLLPHLFLMAVFKEANNNTKPESGDDDDFRSDSLMTFGG